MTTITIREKTTSKRWRGFGNLLRKELGGFWRTRSWMIHLLLYLLLVNGLIAFDAWDTKQAGGASSEVFVSFFAFHALFVMAGVIISAQGSIVGERQDGTAAWILSKPVSRGAFLLSKLTALGGSFFIVGVLVPVIRRK
ncbi:MAG: ABC transporter permease subunit [Chloroflexi bacterium]|nr:ABC transporter permease subunit [Chloroflexota bacterium]